MKRKVEFSLSIILAALLGLAASTSINVGTQVFGICPIANGCIGQSTASSGTVFAGPSSGSAAAPTFRTLNLHDSQGIPRPNIGRWSMIIETGSSGTASRFVGDTDNNAYNVGGTGAAATHNAATASDPAYLECKAGSTLNGNCDWQTTNGGTKIYVVGNNIFFQEFAAVTVGAASSADNERIWFALTDQSSSTMRASDNPAGNYYGFRYSAAADSGHWQCVTKDNSTQTVSSSGISVDTSYHRFEWQADDSVPNVVFKIDGSTVCTVTTHLPTSGTALQTVNSIVTTTAGVNHSTRMGWLFVKTDF